MPYPKGKPQSEESKRKRREAMLRRIAEDPEGWAEKTQRAGKAGTTPEAQAKRRANMKVNGTDRISVEAMGASMARPEVRAKLSAERKQRYANDSAWREKMLKIAAAAQTPEVNERRRVASVAYANTEDGRAAKMRGGMAAMLVLGAAATRKEWSYDGNQFRSSWEVIFAKWLDGMGIRWEYEPETFRLSNGRLYTPDFRVHTANGPVWVEIKGIRRWNADKFELFHREVCVRSLLLSDAEIEAIS